MLGVVELGAAAGLLAQAVVDGAERLFKGTGGRSGARAVGGAGAGGSAGGLAIAGAVHIRIIRQGHRTTATTAGHDQLAIQQVRFDRFVAGFVPLQGFPQAAVAGASAQRFEGAEKLVGEVIVASGDTQWVLSGVGQREEGSAASGCQQTSHRSKAGR